MTNNRQLRFRALLAMTMLLSLRVVEAEPTPASAPAATRPASAPVVSPQPAERTVELLATVETASKVLATSPDHPTALQRRAEALCLLGRIEESVRDFDRVVKLDPDAAPHNWQRGLALYYAGRFKDGAEQFEQHRTVNPQDVENAAWHFLCLSRSIGGEKGIAAAREKLIPIRSDPRIPLMKIHELFAGKASADDVIRACGVGKPERPELNERLFYAYLYLAIYEDASGHPESAAKYANLAATTYAQDGYMGDVARLHAARLKRP